MQCNKPLANFACWNSDEEYWPWIQLYMVDNARRFAITYLLDNGYNLSVKQRYPTFIQPGPVVLARTSRKCSRVWPLSLVRSCNCSLQWHLLNEWETVDLFLTFSIKQNSSEAQLAWPLQNVLCSSGQYSSLLLLQLTSLYYQFIALQAALHLPLIFLEFRWRRTALSPIPISSDNQQQ